MKFAAVILYRVSVRSKHGVWSGERSSLNPAVSKWSGIVGPPKMVLENWWCVCACGGKPTYTHTLDLSSEPLSWCQRNTSLVNWICCGSQKHVVVLEEMMNLWSLDGYLVTHNINCSCAVICYLKVNLPMEFANAVNLTLSWLIRYIRKCKILRSMLNIQTLGYCYM